MATYSHSKLETFKRCRYQYKLTYIDRIKTKTESIEAFVGSRFHELMEELYEKGKEHEYFIEELLDRYEKLWKKKWHNGIKISETQKKAEDYLNYGKQCVRNFYDQELGFGKNARTKTFGVEVKFEFPVDSEGKNKVIGYIDRLAKNKEGLTEIQDYKTSRSLPDEETLKTDRQLSIYQLGLKNLRKGQEINESLIRFVWFYVASGVTFQIKPRSAEELDKLLSEIRSEIQTIEAAHDFPATLNSMCKHCRHQDRCPAYQTTKQFGSD